MLRLIAAAVIACGLAAPAAQAEPQTMSPARSDAPQLPTRLDQGPKIALPPMVIHPSAPPPVDRRPMFLGAGLIAMALVFWWNRRRRDRFEREDDRERSPRRREQRAERRRRARDADADDLHAAAHGDAPDEPAPRVPPRDADR